MLLSNLNGAQESAAAGNENAARGKQGAFTKKVEALVRSGRLTSSVGQGLIDYARQIQDTLNHGGG